MKILAVYGSNYGQAQAVLQRITAVLEGRGHTVSVFRGNAIPADLAVEGFDAIVVAASIILGRYQTYIRDFVKRHHTALCARPTAFVSVNGTAPESMPEWRGPAVCPAVPEADGLGTPLDGDLLRSASVPPVRACHALDREDDQPAA